MEKRYTFRIPTPPLFSFWECLWYLDRGYDDCLYSLYENEIRKVVEFQGSHVVFSIIDKTDFLEITILQGEPTESIKGLLTEYIRDWFDMDRVLSPLYKLLEKDVRLSYMPEAFRGLRLVGIVDLFEALCWGIIGQQINLTFAYKLKRRLVERFGPHLEFEGSIYFLFPSPETLSVASVEELKAMQFSAQKANYLIDLAKVFVNKELSKDVLRKEVSFSEKQKKLTNRKGIGVWTANYVLMKCLRETNSIPYGDAGLLNALIQHHVMEDKKDLLKIEAFFERYKGWESYVVFYLWRSLAVKK